MTRPQLAALIATMLDARDNLALQAKLSGPEGAILARPALKVLNYSLALAESEILERDEAEADLSSPIPEPVRFASSERAPYLELAVVMPTAED